MQKTIQTKRSPVGPSLPAAQNTFTCCCYLCKRTLHRYLYVDYTWQSSNLLFYGADTGATRHPAHTQSHGAQASSVLHASPLGHTNTTHGRLKLKVNLIRGTRTRGHKQPSTLSWKANIRCTLLVTPMIHVFPFHCFALL